MRKVLKIARVFAFSPELLLVVIGVVVEWAFDGKIDNLISRINISDDLLSGRLLFLGFCCAGLWCRGVSYYFRIRIKIIFYKDGRIIGF